MQQGMAPSTNGDNLLISPTSSAQYRSSNQHALSLPYLPNDGDLYGLYSPIFSLTKASPSPGTSFPGGSGSVSLSPSSVSVEEDEDNPVATERRLHLARLALQYQEIADRYELCLSHLEDATQEADALREENAQLRAANSELTRRLSLLAGKQNGHVFAPSAGSAAAALAEEFRRLCAREPPAAVENSPTSVLGFQAERFGRHSAERRVSVPKSISIRSSGFLKLNPSGAGGVGSGLNRNNRLRVSSPVMTRPVQQQQREYTGEGSKKGPSERELEVEVYNQGMFKTELCNKWEETGECPYGEHCQFAHGVDELRPIIRHPRYKTEVCRMVLAGDACPYGHRCHFRHVLSPHDRLLFRPT